MTDIEIALRSLLSTNIVEFTFRKVNGEIRHAKGTRNIVVAENYTSQHINRPMGEEQPNSYYDVEKMGWRSYKPENLMSIDGVIANYSIETDFAKKPTLPNEEPKRENPVQKPVTETKKGELPKRETPANKPMGNGGADIDNLGLDEFVGGMFGMFGGGIPKEEIRKSMDKLNKDIVIGAPAHSPNVGTPIAVEKVFADDFAKLVAHYVVEELINRLK